MSLLQGKYAEAESVYERAQRISEELLGPEHPDVADVLLERGLVLQKQVGGHQVSVRWVHICRVDFQVMWDAADSHQVLATSTHGMGRPFT